jgi:hypothetical protein
MFLEYSENIIDNFSKKEYQRNRSYRAPKKRARPPTRNREHGRDGNAGAGR